MEKMKENPRTEIPNKKMKSGKFLSGQGIKQKINIQINKHKILNKQWKY